MKSIDFAIYYSAEIDIRKLFFRSFLSVTKLLLKLSVIQ